MSHNTIPSAQPPARRNQLDVLEDIAEGIGELVDAGGGGGSGGPDKELITLSYTANKAFTGASQGDLITGTLVVNVSGASPAIESSVWYNQTTRTNLASAPLAADIDLAGGGGGATNAQLVAALATQTTSLKDGTNATAAKQDTGNTSLSNIDGKTPALVSGRIPVDPSGVTSPVSVASLPLPSGAATSAAQTTGNTSLGTIATAAGAPADAAAASATSSGSIIAVLKGLWKFFTDSAGSAVDDLSLSNTYQSNRSLGYLYDTDTTFLSRFRGSKRGLWVEGGVAHAGTDSGNPVKVGGRYNSSATALTNGQRSDLLMNVDGAVLVSMAGSSNTSDTINNNTTQLFRSRTGTDVLPAFGNMYYDGNALAWVRARGSVARGALVDIRSTVQVTTLQNAATTVVAGSSTAAPAGRKTFQAFGTVSTSTGAATINIEGSNNGTNWDVIGTFSLTLGTAAVSDSFTSDDRYAFVRSNVTAISGTAASVTINMGT